MPGADGPLYPHAADAVFGRAPCAEYDDDAVVGGFAGVFDDVGVCAGADAETDAEVDVAVAANIGRQQRCGRLKMMMAMVML